jgi:hypothetical protein
MELGEQFVDAAGLILRDQSRVRFDLSTNKV